MISFINSMDRKIWKTISSGWSPPMIIEVHKSESMKPEKDWTPDEDETSLGNFMSLKIFTIELTTTSSTSSLVLKRNMKLLK